MTDKKVPPEFEAPEGAAFRCAGFDHRNFKPHPYMITPRHVAWASDNHGGILDGYAIEQAELHGAHCGVGRHGDGGVGRATGCYTPCVLPYHQHTSDKVLVVVLQDDHPQDLNAIDGLGKWWCSIKEEATKQGVTGFIFPTETQHSRR